MSFTLPPRALLRRAALPLTALLTTATLALVAAMPAAIAAEPGDYPTLGELPNTVTSYTYRYEQPDGEGSKRSTTIVQSSTTIFTVYGTKDHVFVGITDAAIDWRFDFSPNLGDALRPGVFLHAERNAFRTGRAPGLDVSSGSSGCNMVWGQFSVNQIGFDERGNVDMLDLDFVHHCESPTSPALIGTLLIAQRPLSVTTVAEPDEPVTGGGRLSFVNDTSVIGASGDAGQVQVAASGHRRRLNLRASAPTGEVLVPGRVYDIADEPDATHAGLEVYVYGRSCTGSSGTLQITRLFAGPNDTMEHLALSFVYYCYGAGPALRGTVHYYA